MKMNTTAMILVAFCAAIIAVLAQITIPLPLIPITGQTLAIGLVVTILGRKYGTYSVLLYILLGAIGFPVFQAMTGGIGILFGPTGGYIIGFIPTAIIIGHYLEKFGFTITHAIVANIIGMFVTLIFGAYWLKVLNHLTWEAAFIGGVVPFIIVGIVKSIVAAFIGIIVHKRLTEAKLITKLS